MHEPTRSESEGEHVCGPDVILTAGERGAREGARVKIMSGGCPQTAGRASRSAPGLAEKFLKIPPCAVALEFDILCARRPGKGPARSLKAGA